MRTHNRNKTDFWYALYSATEPTYDEYGNETGEPSVSYGKPVAASGNISPARGTAEIEQFGIGASYTNTIVPTNKDCPITETSVIWTSQPAVDEQGNLIYETNGDMRTPYEYTVSAPPAKSKNSLTIAVRKVDVT